MKIFKRNSDDREINRNLDEAERGAESNGFIAGLVKRSAPSIKDALSTVAPDITRITKELKDSKTKGEEEPPEIPQPEDHSAAFLRATANATRTIRRTPSSESSTLVRKIHLTSDGSDLQQTGSEAESIVTLPQVDQTVKALSIVQKVNTQGFKAVINSVYDLSSITRAIYAQEAGQFQILNESLSNLVTLTNIGGAASLTQAGSAESLLTSGFSIARLTQAMNSRIRQESRTKWTNGSSLGGETDINELILELTTGLSDDPKAAISKFASTLLVDRVLGSKKEKINSKARELSLNLFDALSNPDAILNNKYVDKALGLADKIGSNKFLSKIPMLDMLQRENATAGIKDFLKSNRKAMFGDYDPNVDVDLSNRVSKSTAVPFDMGTHVTINEVIPGYLAKILSTITGAPEIYHNYTTGKWMTKAELEAERTKRNDKSITSALKTNRLKDFASKVWGEDGSSKADLFSKIVTSNAMSAEDLEKLKDGTNDSDIDKLIDYISSGKLKSSSYRNAVIALRAKYKSISSDIISGSAKNAFSSDTDNKLRSESTSTVTRSEKEPVENRLLPPLLEVDRTTREIKELLQREWDTFKYSPDSESEPSVVQKLLETTLGENTSPLVPKALGVLEELPIVKNTKLGGALQALSGGATLALPAPATSKALDVLDNIAPKLGGATLALPAPATSKALGVLDNLPILKSDRLSNLVKRSSALLPVVGKTTLPDLVPKSAPNLLKELPSPATAVGKVVEGVAETTIAPKITKPEGFTAKIPDDMKGILDQIKKNGESFTEESLKFNQKLESQASESNDIASKILGPGMAGILGAAGKATSATGATTTTAGLVGKAVKATGGAGGILKGLSSSSGFLKALLGIGGGLVAAMILGKTTSKVSADSIIGPSLDKSMVESGIVSRQSLQAMNSAPDALNRQALYLSPVGSAVLTSKYGLNPTNPSESVMGTIDRWLDSLTNTVKTASAAASGGSSSSSSSSAAGSAGTSTSIPTDRKAFLKLSINNTFKVDKDKMYADLKKNSKRVKRWLGGIDANIDKVYNIVKQAGMSPELFFAYELQEGLTSPWGWLNHTYYTGDPYGDARSVASWAVALANDTSPMKLAWADGANSPAAPSPEVQAKGNVDANSLPGGSIGRLYLRGTAAAVWGTYAPEWLNASVNGVSTYGDPIQGCIDTLKRWGASVSNSSSSSSSTSNSSSNTSSSSSTSGSTSSSASSSGSVSASQTKGINYAESMLGRVVTYGQCYAFTSEYAKNVDPEHIPNGLVGHMAAADIGSDYPWTQWGWEVIFNPKYSDLRPGDIINYKRSQKYDPDYGHTGVVGMVPGNNKYELYDQNPTPLKKRTIDFIAGDISSIIHPPGSIGGSTATANNGLSNSVGTETGIQWKLSDAEQQKIKDRVFKKYTKAYEESIKRGTTSVSQAVDNSIDNFNGGNSAGNSTSIVNNGGSSSSTVLIDGNGNYIIQNPGSSSSNALTGTVVNNYYTKVDEKVSQESLNLINGILNSVKTIGTYTSDNLATLREILLRLDKSNDLLDTNNNLSATANDLLKRLRLGGSSSTGTLPINSSSSTDNLDFLLDLRPMEPIVRGLR